MKIIHAADLHIGSKINNLNDKLKVIIKNESLYAFEQMINYAIKNDIKIIMLSGDVFDSDKVTKSDKTLFYKLIEKNKDIDFIYLKGNHDKDNIYDIEYDNLKTFDNSWKYYRYQNIVIAGIEINEINYKAFYSSLTLNKDDFNIVMLHGDNKNLIAINNVNIKKLENKNIDYLALGHIHKMMDGRIDDRGVYKYPGSLIGRGFDELGDKGFYCLEIDDNKIIKNEFIKINRYSFNEYPFDLSKYDNEADFLNDLNTIKTGNYEIVKVLLEGRTNLDTSALIIRIKSRLEGEVPFVKVKDESREIVDIKKYLKEESLIGEFVRKVDDNTTYDEKTKDKILSLGLKLLNGEEI